MQALGCKKNLLQSRPMERFLPEIRWDRISDISRLWREESPEAALYEICLADFIMDQRKETFTALC
jgi:hypothetical protein